MNTYDSSDLGHGGSVYRLGGLLLAIVCGFLCCGSGGPQLLPLQNFYLADYVLTKPSAATNPTRNPVLDNRAGQKQFNVVMAGPLLATDTLLGLMPEFPFTPRD